MKSTICDLLWWNLFVWNARLFVRKNNGMHSWRKGAWLRVWTWAIFSLRPPSPGVLLLSPLLVGVKPYNAQTGTTLNISMTLILWLTFIRPRKPRKATRKRWEFNSSRILHAANPNKLLASQSQQTVGSSTTLFCFNRTGQNKLIIDLINWRLLVMRVLWPFLSPFSCELSKNRGSSSFIPLYQVAV